MRVEVDVTFVKLPDDPTKYKPETMAAAVICNNLAAIAKQLERLNGLPVKYLDIAE